MENNTFDLTVDDIITLFIDKFNFKILNLVDGKDIILNIIIDFNRNCLSDQFITDYLLLFLKKIQPTFCLSDLESKDDLSIIHYSEFFIVFLMILTKYAEDAAYLNRDFSYYYSIPIKRINNLEIFILKNINWDLSIKNQEELATTNM
jgi:hypothetical protein